MKPDSTLTTENVVGFAQLGFVQRLPSRRFICAACGDKCRSSIADRGKRTLCRPCEIGRRHHTVDGGKLYNAAWAWVNLGACTINGVSYAKDRRTGITYRAGNPLPNVKSDGTAGDGTKDHG